MEKSRAMRIAANLPHDLWKEIVNCAAYLQNRTPRESNSWKTPYEVFYSYLAERDGQTTPKRPQLAHLKAYGCRAYAMTRDAQLKRNKKMKLDPRAHIGYLVGYDSTNIFRVWIPHRAEVISTRDVLFDETTFFDGKVIDLSQQLVAEMDTLVAKVRLPEAQAGNEQLLEEDEEVLEPSHEDDEEEEDDTPIQPFDEKEDYELARTLEEALQALPSPPPSEDPDSPFAFHVQFPVANSVSTIPAHSSPSKGVDYDQEISEDQTEDRFEDFRDTKITSAYHGA